MNRDELIVVHGTEYKEMTKKLLELSGLEHMIPDKHTLIGIKPNLVGPIPAEQGATTHPEVVAGLIEYLQSRGFSRLVLLESSWVGDKTEDAVHICGYDRILERYQIPFWDMQQDKGISVDCGGLALKLCERAREIEFLINVPVLKGHCQTKVTCALKNMKGLIPNAEKRRFHRMGLHRPIAHLSLGVHQDFILTDSICGDLTFEDGGNPVPQNRLIAALDPVLMDAYACRVVGIAAKEVEYIQTARALGIGTDDLSAARIRVYRMGEDLVAKADGADAAKTAQTDGADAAGISVMDSSWPEGGIPGGEEGWRHVLRLAERTQEIDSCSACYANLIPALSQLQEEGLLEHLKEKVCIGQGYRGKDGVLGVGNCTHGFTYTLAGCPPTRQEMYDFLRAYLCRRGR